mmetsp:Transcript_350/g.1155  ORF Transcript_350/g.1155 Transcript_350/m.1155 type:complete len:223 (-) Transcript_350:321-989(-)
MLVVSVDHLKGQSMRLGVRDGEVEGRFDTRPDGRQKGTAVGAPLPVHVDIEDVDWVVVATRRIGRVVVEVVRPPRTTTAAAPKNLAKQPARRDDLCVQSWGLPLHRREEKHVAKGPIEVDVWRLHLSARVRFKVAPPTIFGEERSLAPRGGGIDQRVLQPSVERVVVQAHGMPSQRTVEGLNNSVGGTLLGHHVFRRREKVFVHVAKVGSSPEAVRKVPRHR